ncbi:MAG: DUF6666 family protein [Planctomycetaceae bacterium]
MNETNEPELEAMPELCSFESSEPAVFEPSTYGEEARHGLAVFVDYDAFRGISDGTWGNNGIRTGLNYGTALGAISDATGIGFQAGASVGVYNWSGTDYRPTDQNRAQTQGFITYGFFHRAHDDSKWSAALVQDWMLNDNFGIYAQDPTLSQFRAQLGYATGEWDELGVWGTWRILDDTRLVGPLPWDPTPVGPVLWRPYGHLSFFWHHKWEPNGADSWIWVGLPEQGRAGGSGTLGDYLVGASANVPLCDWLMLCTLLTYMHPSAGPGPAGSVEDHWNFTLGLSVYPRGDARSPTLAGRRWMPLLPVANNGYFLVDTDHY